MLIRSAQPVYSVLNHMVIVNYLFLILLSTTRKIIRIPYSDSSYPINMIPSLPALSGSPLFFGIIPAAPKGSRERSRSLA